MNTRKQQEKNAAMNKKGQQVIMLSLLSCTLQHAKEVAIEL